MLEKKIVIKLNYATPSPQGTELTDPGGQMISEWNYKRIFIALTILLLVIGIITFGLTALFSGHSNMQQNAISEPPSETNKSPLQLRGNDDVTEPSRSESVVTDVHEQLSVLAFESDVQPKIEAGKSESDGQQVDGDEIAKVTIPQPRTVSEDKSSSGPQNAKMSGIVRGQFTWGIYAKELTAG